MSSTALAQSLWLEPAISRPADPVFQVQVWSECLSRQVQGMEAVISFDPHLVRLDSITPGAWFTGAGSQYFFSDHTSTGTGKIHFAGALLEGSSSADEAVAHCHFSALGQGQTGLRFQAVDVRDVRDLDLDFGHSTGDLIILETAVWNRERSFGALKAIYR